MPGLSYLKYRVWLPKFLSIASNDPIPRYFFNLIPSEKKYSPGASVVAARREPIITKVSEKISDSSGSRRGVCNAQCGDAAGELTLEQGFCSATGGKGWGRACIFGGGQPDPVI